MSLTNKPSSTWSQINKKVAEEQTIYVEQKATINAYNKTLAKLTADCDLLKYKIQIRNEKNKVLEEDIAAKPAQIERSLNHLKLLEGEVARTVAEIKELEQCMNTEWAKHRFQQDTRAEKFNEIKEAVLSTHPKYREYKALKDSKGCLAEKNKQLQTDCEAQLNELNMVNKRKDEARNKQIVALVARIVELKKCQSLKKEHEESNKRYEAATQKLMKMLLIQDQASTEVENVKEDTFSVENNTKTIDRENLRKLIMMEQDECVSTNGQNMNVMMEQEMVCTNEPNINREEPVKLVDEFFKVPVAPATNSNGTAHKFSVLQNIDVRMAKAKTDAKPCSEAKRKDDGIPSPSRSVKRQKSNSFNLETVPPLQNEDFGAFSFLNSGPKHMEYTFSSELDKGDFAFTNFDDASDSDKNSIPENDHVFKMSAGFMGDSNADNVFDFSSF